MTEKQEGPAYHWPKLYSVDEVKKTNKFLKFVRVIWDEEGNGGWRFWECDSMFSHREMVKNGEKAVAAGLISSAEDAVIMQDSYSSSLEVGTSEEHWKALEAYLGTKIKSKYE